ncbi:MAG: phosphatase PAP2 family protein [Candidatus Aenigmarchaeota archaeon]|nr:phosphatase PAP2 family protein [Candidatus Aenigmarchaeota archaeon]
MENVRFALETLWKNTVADVSALGGLPFYAVVVLYHSMTNAAAAWKLAYALALLFVVVYSIKLVYFKARPDVAKRRFATLAERLESSSFPSVHAVRAWLLYVALFYSSMPLFGAALATAVCVTRILLRRHHLIDVVAGSLIGGIVGYYVFVA